MQVLKELQEESLKARSGIAGGNPGGNPGGPSAGGGGGGSGGLAAGSKSSGGGKASGGVFGAAGWAAASQGARGSDGASDPMSKEWRHIDDLEKHIGNLQRFATELAVSPVSFVQHGRSFPDQCEVKRH